jgi:hypothetical protein
MIVSVHQPQYIPWLGFFDKIAKSDCFVFLDQVQYKPREFHNRNKIRAQKGWIWLTVPVVCKGLSRQKIDDCAIDNTFPWARKHELSLKACYGKANFFPEYFPFFEQIYAKKWDRLADLNVGIISYILKQLTISKPIYFESQLNIAQKSTDRIIEICRKLKADTYLSGSGGKDYLDEAKLEKAKIKLIYQDFTHPAYRQQFMRDKDDFLAHMSTLDLIFNEGPKSKEILNRGGK